MWEPVALPLPFAVPRRPRMAPGVDIIPVVVVADAAVARHTGWYLGDPNVAAVVATLDVGIARGDSNRDSDYDVVLQSQRHNNRTHQEQQEQHGCT